ncbi:MAG TPA: glycosyltransferase [Candidatus Syntrophosphaera sp.]|nr:glycosyltransferase [Candidatus Syntrophosphaera sp.]
MRVLYISYFYPPLGGPAVLRNVKTVKYLAESGIACDVITTREPEYLYRDSSLLAECREEKLMRTASLDPMSLLKKTGLSRDRGASRFYLQTPERLKLAIRRLHPIDDKIGWVPFLIKAGRSALAARRYDLIYISLGPFSSALGAYRLAEANQLPLAVDLRDYWNLLSDYDLQGTRWQRRFSLHWERKIYRRAGLIVTATRGIGDDIACAFGSNLADKILTAYNGWDEADFTDLPAAEKQPGFTLAYFGNLYARRHLRAFYAAVKTLRVAGSLPKDTRILLYGNFFREAQQDVAHSGISDLIQIVPQLDHWLALSQMLAADVLLLAINSSSPRGTLSSKIFEYLRAQKPILAMVPAQNEAAGLLRACNQDLICAMESPDSILHCLKRVLNEPLRQYHVPWELERQAQIRKLAQTLQARFGN